MENGERPMEKDHQPFLPHKEEPITYFYLGRRLYHHQAPGPITGARPCAAAFMPFMLPDSRLSDLIQ